MTTCQGNMTTCQPPSILRILPYLSFHTWASILIHTLYVLPAAPLDNTPQRVLPDPSSASFPAFPSSLHPFSRVNRPFRGLMTQNKGILLTLAHALDVLPAAPLDDAPQRALEDVEKVVVHPEADERLHWKLQNLRR